MSWFDKVLSWIGFEVVEEDDDDDLDPFADIAAAEEPLEELDEEDWTFRPAERSRDWDDVPARPAPGERERAADGAGTRSADRSNLVSLPGSGVANMRMIVVTPTDFDQVQSVADHLKARRPVSLNLEGLDKDVSQRIVNFLSGTIYALNGEMHKISNSVILFAPNNVEVIDETPGRSRFRS